MRDPGNLERSVTRLGAFAGRFAALWCTKLGYRSNCRDKSLKIQGHTDGPIFAFSEGMHRQTRRFRIGKELLAATALLLPLSSFADDFSYEIELEQHEAGTFYVKARLADIADTPMLIDTGSSYVALTRKTFRSLKSGVETEHLRDIEGEMAAGRRIKVAIYRLARLDLGNGCVLRDVEVAGVPGATRDILGISALSRLQPFAISMNPPKLLFSHCSTPDEELVADKAVMPPQTTAATVPF